MITINRTHRTNSASVAFIGLGLAVLAGCAGISDFNSWAAEDAQPAAHVAVFAPADSHAEAALLEGFYCDHVNQINPTVKCDTLTNQFPVGQEISEEALDRKVSDIDPSHLVTISMLKSTPRTNTNATLLGSFVWGHSNHYEENLHQVQILDLTSLDVAYSAQLQSNSGAAITRRGYLNAFARRLARDQRDQGIIAAM